MFDIVSLSIALFTVLAGWYFWEKSRRVTHAMTGGVHKEITLPHEETWELYHNSFSIFSKKTRVCLFELGIAYKSHHINLITTGSFGNLSRDFLKVNPAAFVPVLVHQGHPVYESHEQLTYAAAHSHQTSLLVPEDEEKLSLMKHWVEMSSSTSDDPIKTIEEGPGNTVIGLSLPFFAVMTEQMKTYHILEGLLFHRIKLRGLVLLLFKILGAQRIFRIKYFTRILAKSKNAMHLHLDKFEQALSRYSGPWIVGDQFTLADVGMLTILDHLKDIDFLDYFLTDSRPNLQTYWRALQQRPSYKAGILDLSHPNIVNGRERIIEIKKSDPTFRNALEA